MQFMNYFYPELYSYKALEISIMKIVRILLLIFSIVVVVIAGSYVFFLLSLSWAFNNKGSSEELKREFIEHEKEFADLAASFRANIPKNKKQLIYFGLGRGNRVNLNIYPVVIDSANKITGGSDLKPGSPELDSALVVLGWTNDTVKMLRQKLSKTNCDWITAADQPNNLIKVYSAQSKWGPFTYYIFDRPVNDTLARLYGGPINNSEFGKRVTLKCDIGYIGL